MKNMTSCFVELLWINTYSVDLLLDILVIMGVFIYFIIIFYFNEILFAFY